VTTTSAEAYTLEPVANPWIVVVGCGGTGGFVAEGLCRMLAHRVALVLVDHDRVEERNLLRQNFYHDEIGMFKSEAMAKRLSRLYRRPVGWTVVPFGTTFERFYPPGLLRPGIVIGCVDNAQAREGIASMLRFGSWWVDAGNGENWGQVLIGNSRRDQLDRVFVETNQVCHRLPLPTLQHPELLSPPPAEEVRPLSCAELMDTGDQDPTINQAMATLVLQVVRRLLMGECPWMALYLDLRQGTLNPVPATPQNVARIAHVRESRLIFRSERR
jgi:PRTRC genetic system ThiF family protein